MNIVLTPEQLEMVRRILKNHLPQGAKVFVFGSRAAGNPKKFSDLDLAIDNNGQSLPLSLEAELAFDFEESDFPYKVDLVDLNTISESFKSNIKDSFIVLL